MDPSLPQIPGFRVLKRLGAGGMGAVFLVERQSEPGVQRALKVIRAENPRVLERLRREAEFLQRLGAHPNLVRCYDYGEQGPTAYLLMDYVPGEDLSEIVRRGQISWRRGVEIVRDVAHALARAHEAGILHRDLKPSNIILDDSGTPRLLDFGVALAEDLDRLTRTGVIVGTPAYYSPEQAQNKELDVRSDVYSLGATLFHLLTGQAPFVAENQLALVGQIAFERPPSSSSINPNVPRSLDRLLQRVLAKDPHERPQTAEALAAELDRVLAAQGDGPGVAKLAAAVLGLVAVVAGLSFGLAVWSRSSTEAPPPSPTKPADADDLRRRVRAAYERGEVELAREHLGDRAQELSDMPETAWVLALCGELESALKADAGKTFRPWERVRLAAWAGQGERAREALAAIDDARRRRALSWELRGYLAISPPRAKPEVSLDMKGWEAVARGEEALAGSELVLAAACFKAGLQDGTTPASVGARLGLARVQLARGAFRTAVKELIQVSKQARAPLLRARALGWLAQAAIALGRPTVLDPSNALANARAFAPGIPEVLQATRSAAVVPREVGEADPDLDRLPPLPEVLRRAQRSDAGSRLVDRAARLVRLAESTCYRPSAREGRALLRRAARLRPGDLRVWAARARAALILHKSEEALACVERARRVGPKHWRVHLLHSAAITAHLGSIGKELPPDQRTKRQLEMLERANAACRLALAAAPPGAAQDRCRLLLARGIVAKTWLGEPPTRLVETLAPLLTGIDVAEVGRARASLADALARGDAQAVRAAEDALAAPRVGAATLNALLQLAQSRPASPPHAKALLALAGDLPARAVLHAQRGGAGLTRALALAPDLPVLLLARASRTDGKSPRLALDLAGVVKADPMRMGVAMNLLRSRLPRAVGPLLEKLSEAPGPRLLARALVLATDLTRLAGSARKKRALALAWRTYRAATRAIVEEGAGPAGHQLRLTGTSALGPANHPDLRGVAAYDLSCLLAGAPWSSSALRTAVFFADRRRVRHLTDELLAHGLLTHPNAIRPNAPRTLLTTVVGVRRRFLQQWPDDPGGDPRAIARVNTVGRNLQPRPGTRRFALSCLLVGFPLEVRSRIAGPTRALIGALSKGELKDHPGLVNAARAANTARREMRRRPNRRSVAAAAGPAVRAISMSEPGGYPFELLPHDTIALGSRWPFTPRPGRWTGQEVVSWPAHPALWETWYLLQRGLTARWVCALSDAILRPGGGGAGLLSATNLANAWSHAVLILHAPQEPGINLAVAEEGRTVRSADPTESLLAAFRAAAFHRSQLPAAILFREARAWRRLARRGRGEACLRLALALAREAVRFVTTPEDRELAGVFRIGLLLDMAAAKRPPDRALLTRARRALAALPEAGGPRSDLGHVGLSAVYRAKAHLALGERAKAEAVLARRFRPHEQDYPFLGSLYAEFDRDPYLRALRTLPPLSKRMPEPPR